LGVAKQPGHDGGEYLLDLGMAIDNLGPGITQRQWPSQALANAVENFWNQGLIGIALQPANIGGALIEVLSAGR